MKKNTKSALLLSVVSIVICCTMLLGTTMAWFTDSVTSSSNIIKSGTLKVSMDWLDGTLEPTDDAEWKDASEGAIFNYELWEPGYTEVRHVKITNDGTLALKYELKIVANGEVSKLSDVIDVYYVDPAVQVTDRTALANIESIGTLTDVLANLSTTASGSLEAGEEVTITLALKMQEEAGNEYQDLSIGTDFSVQLLATQYTYENDSFDNQYDADAEYAITVNSDASLHSALEDGGNVIIDGEINNGITKAYSNGNTRELYLNSEIGEITLSGGKIILDENATYGLYPYAKGNPITVKDMEVESNAKFGIVAWPSTATDLVTIENVDVKAAGGVGIYAYGPGKTVVNNCTVGQSGLDYAETPWANTAIAASTGAVFEINGGEYTGSDYVLWIYNSGATVTINGGTFNGAIKVDAGSVTINAGTFSVDPSTVSRVTVNGKIANNGDGTWTVTAE